MYFQVKFLIVVLRLENLIRGFLLLILLNLRWLLLTMRIWLESIVSIFSIIIAFQSNQMSYNKYIIHDVILNKYILLSKAALSYHHRLSGSYHA